MNQRKRAGDDAPRRRGGPRALLICGSQHQTRQMLQIAAALPEIEARFTPYYVEGALEVARRAGLLDRTIAGGHWRDACLSTLREAGVAVDDRGRGGPYDLVVTAQDAYVPKGVRGGPLVLVQEGMTDPEDFLYHLVRVFRSLPLWLAGTAAFGQSDAYVKFCVGSEGYADFFAERGVRRDKMVVTGVPDFDDCARHRAAPFPHRGYVLVATSDGRETLKRDDREGFLRRACAIAAGRPMIFKLHPNEDFARARREIAAIAPTARVLTGGSAEVMVAHCDALVCEWSTLAYVGLALGKPVHSNFDARLLKRLLPLQHGRAAANVAAVCREVLGLEPAREGRGERAREEAIA